MKNETPVEPDAGSWRLARVTLLHDLIVVAVADDFSPNIRKNSGPWEKVKDFMSLIHPSNDVSQVDGV